MLADFTTPDEIRAVLGVAESELPDVVIELPLYERLLSMDLREVSLDIETDYLALPTDPDLRTAGEQLFYDCAQVYAACAVALVLVANEAMFAPEVITDSKTTLQRKDPYEEARASVQALYRVVRARLAAAYTALNPAVSVLSPTMIFSRGVSLGSDPVTGT